MSTTFKSLIWVSLLITLTGVGCSNNYCLKGKKACSITIERTPCYGTCPIYTMTISNNGLVEFEGRKFVKREGNYQMQLSQAETDSLFTYAHNLEWKSFEATYGSDYTDLPSNIITYRTKSAQEVKITGKGPKELFSLIKKMDALRDQSGWNKVDVKTP